MEIEKKNIIMYLKKSKTAFTLSLEGWFRLAVNPVHFYCELLKNGYIATDNWKKTIAHLMTALDCYSFIKNFCIYIYKNSKCMIKETS